MSGTLVSRSARLDDRPISQQVLHAVADREEVSPLDLNQRLYEAVDPDALDALFAGDTRPDAVEFTYHGYRITVEGPGRLGLTPVDRPRD